MIFKEKTHKRKKGKKKLHSYSKKKKGHKKVKEIVSESSKEGSDSEGEEEEGMWVEKRISQ
jgi:hypothetical protein